MVLLLITDSLMGLWMISRVEVVLVELKYCMDSTGEVDLMLNPLADLWKVISMVLLVVGCLALCLKETVQTLGLQVLKETGWHRCLDVNSRLGLMKMLVFLDLLIQVAQEILRVIPVS